MESCHHYPSAAKLLPQTSKRFDNVLLHFSFSQNGFGFVYFCVIALVAGSGFPVIYLRGFDMDFQRTQSTDLAWENQTSDVFLCASA